MRKERGMSGSNSAGSKRRKGSDEKKKRKKKEKVDGETCRNTGIPTTVSWCCCFSSQRPFVVKTALFFCVYTGAHGAASLSLFFFFFLFLFFCTLCSGSCANTFFFFSCHKLHASRFTCFTALNFGGGQRGLNCVSVFGLSGIKIQCHTERFEM